MRSMVRAMSIALGFIAVAGMAGAQAAAPIKIGYVNTQLLMEAAPGRAQTHAAQGQGQGQRQG